MRATLLRVAEDLRDSYWFVPAVMVLAAMVLASAMIFVDSHAGSHWMDGLPWLYAARPDGARQMLSAISGSMITVAGTVFSVTIAAVVYASGQYGPRLLSNFMSDRGNKVTLGTFIATFVYCLLVLRTIRSSAESGGEAGFVPNLALLIAVALALCSIAVLIFFIHHVPSQLHINSVIEDVGQQLLQAIDHQFPGFIGAPRSDDDGSAPDPRIPSAFRRQADDRMASRRAQIEARVTGYLQVIDDETLMRQARAHDLVLRPQYRPGDFVHAGRTLLEAYPPERCSEEIASALRSAFATGSRRTALQDMRFLIDELVEIAARALSPGVNDPFTAITCLDWISAAMSTLAGRELPSHLRCDEDGDLRVIAHPVTFEQFLDRAFGALAPYCAGDRVAARGFVKALSEVALGCERPERLKAIAAHAGRLEALTRQKLLGDDRADITRRCVRLRRVLSGSDHKRRLRDGNAGAGGGDA